MNTLSHLADMIYRGLWDWPIGTMLDVMLIASICVLVVLVAGLIFSLCDEVLLPTSRSSGRVEGRRFVAAHTKSVLRYNPIFKMAMPVSVSVPNHWYVTVRVGKERDDLSISKGAYERLSEGQDVHVEYAHRRFTKTLRLEQILTS